MTDLEHEAQVTIIGSGGRAETFNVTVPSMRWCRRCRNWFKEDDATGAQPYERPSGMFEWRTRGCKPKCQRAGGQP